MTTAFKQVANNALSTTTTNLTATGVTSLALSSGDGAKFPQPGNGFILTLWNGVSPSLDANMEKVTTTARSSDTLTISATAKVHGSPTYVGLLDVSENISDLQTAVNALEDAPDDLHYSQSFSSASTVVVTHNLGKKPAVSILDTSNDECEGAVVHNSDNQLTVSFSASFSGVILCN